MFPQICKTEIQIKNRLRSLVEFYRRQLNFKTGPWDNNEELNLIAGCLYFKFDFQ